jgi:hypothetical protein
MSSLRFRDYHGPEDIENQYLLWQKATDGLVYAWRSNMTNARYLGAQAQKYPGARIYAETESGELMGYIGTHPPFEWEPGRWAVPFGFPWTYPTDEGLERELYDRMRSQTPIVYGGLKMDFYVQRFRSLWKRQLEFMAARGWQPRWRHPIWAQAVADVDDTAAAATEPVTANDLNVVSEYARVDDQMSDPPSVEELLRRLEAGWLELDAMRLLPGDGAFALEVRRPWAEVKLFCARPGAMGRVLEAARATARRSRAEEIYFTLRESAKPRIEALGGHGFREACADIYVVCDLAP